MDPVIAIHSWLTVVSLLAFLGIVGWAYSGSRRDRFESTGMSVLEDDDTPAAAGTDGRPA